MMTLRHDPGIARPRGGTGALTQALVKLVTIKRKADGGLGSLENAQLTHPYCNTTIKN